MEVYFLKFWIVLFTVSSICLIKRSSENAEANSEIAEESERAIVDVETLQKTNKDIIETLDKVLEIHENGKVKRAEAEKELVEIERELKEKLVEIKVEPKN